MVTYHPREREASPHPFRNATLNDPVRHASTGIGMLTACMIRNSDPIPLSPMRLWLRVIASPDPCTPALYPSKHPPIGFQNPELARHHSLSSLGPIPANPAPPFPHPSLPVNDPLHRWRDLRGNSHLAYATKWGWVLHRMSRSYRGPMTLRNASHVSLGRPSRSFHLSIFKPYLGLSQYHYHSSRRSTCRFPPSLGATLT